MADVARHELKAVMERRRGDLEIRVGPRPAAFPQCRLDLPVEARDRDVERQDRQAWKDPRLDVRDMDRRALRRTASTRSARSSDPFQPPVTPARPLPGSAARSLCSRSTSPEETTAATSRPRRRTTTVRLTFKLLRSRESFSLEPSARHPAPERTSSAHA